MLSFANSHAMVVFLRRRFKWSIVLLLGLIASATVQAALPSDPAERAAIVGQPIALQIQPAVLTLAGPRATQQLVITGQYADGSIRDLTPFCDLITESAGIVSIGTDGLMLPHGDGSTNLIVKAGGQSVRVPVEVKDFNQAQ